ncbi:hypothetical protein ABZ342_21595 [Amycolatopsis sp. NPDC005961]|uniref:hypothetical protein n=1 Tax=Amycolatopsis sp. NPDC005961 TaxID=3156720 RepID=UPI0033D902E8
MSVTTPYPRPATPRGGPWSPAVRRLLHERRVDPARFDIGPHRLTARILTALLDAQPAAGSVTPTAVHQAAAEVPDVSPDRLAALLGAAVARVWSGAGPVPRVVVGSVPGVRTAPAAAPGEAVLAAGVPTLDVVPVRLSDGQPALAWRTRVPLTLVAPADLDGAGLFRAIADQVSSPDRNGVQ